MNNIEVKNLTFSFKENNVFTDLNFMIKSESFTSIIINNGKTTFMNILSGIINTNSVYIDNKKITMNEINKIGYVYANNIFTNEIVKDEILFGLNNINNRESEILLNEVVDLFDIKEILNYNIRYLNSREKTIVKLASALIKKPEILIIDDILNIFNNLEKDKIFKILKKLNQKQNMTIINITSNIEEVLYSKDAIVIDKKVIIKGKTKKVLEEIKQIEQFGLPFIVDLSNKLKYYEVIDKLILKKDEMVDAIWD